MQTDKLFSIAAALFLSTAMLQAAPDHDSRDGNGKGNVKQDRSYNRDTSRNQEVRRDYSRPSQGEVRRDEVRRDYNQPSKGEIRRDEVRRVEPQKYTPHPVKPVPVVRPSKVERRDPVQVERSRPGGSVVRVEKHKQYYRPPGARPIAYYQRPGYIVNSLPRIAISLSLGGIAFYYADGVYYRRHNSGFVVSVPPVGLFVNTLPIGYTVFLLGGLTYYYYADVYYRWDINRNAYRVVQAPVAYDDVDYTPGQVLDALPDGAYSVTINGVQYYRYADVYFMQSVQGNRVVYIVVTP